MTPDFGGTSGTVTVSGAINSVNSLTFDADSYTLSGGTLTLTGNGANITTGAGVDTIRSAITGSAGLTKSGVGTLSLFGDSSYSGGTTLSQGQINLGSATALGTGTFTISGAGSCVINSPYVTNLTMSNNNPMVWNGDFTFGDSNSNTYMLNLGNGRVTLAADCTLTCTVNTLTVGGVISGNHALTEKGPYADATLALYGANSYTGGTTFNAGELRINNGQALGTGPITIGYGATMCTIRNTAASSITLSNNNPLTFSNSGMCD